MTTNRETDQENKWITFSLMKTLAYIEVIHILKRIVWMMTSLECKVDIYVLKSLKNKCFSLLGEEICVPEVILIFLIYCLKVAIKDIFLYFEKRKIMLATLL